MDTPVPPSFDPSALTYRSYVNRLSSATSPSATNIPSYQELTVLQQELQHLSEQASLRYERYSSELVRLETGSSAGAAVSQSKDSSVSSTPTSSTSSAFNSTLPGLSASSAHVATGSGRTSASPNTSSPSAFSSSSRTGGGSAGTLTSGTAATASPIVKLKLKRPDAPGTEQYPSSINDDFDIWRQLTKIP